jgi:ABC-type transport system involved in multi-copper enzyme maturation permease subunit
MLVTRLSPTAVVLGKVVSSISYNLLLIIATLPLFSIVFLFGGISPKQFALTFAVYGVTALLMGALGIFCSAVFRRTQVATVVVYAVALFLLFGTTVAGVLWNEIIMNPGPQYQPRYGPPFITYFNPLSALMSAISNNPYGQYISYLPIPMPGMHYGPPPPGITAPWPAWQYNFIISGIAIVVLLLLTIWLVRPVKRFRMPDLGFLRRRRDRALAKDAASEAAQEIAAEKNG